MNKRIMLWVLSILWLVIVTLGLGSVGVKIVARLGTERYVVHEFGVHHSSLRCRFISAGVGFTHLPLDEEARGRPTALARSSLHTGRIAIERERDHLRPLTTDESAG